jgi:arylsulfatase A-like enzyme
MGRPQAANSVERSKALANIGLALGGALLTGACEDSGAPDPTAGILLVSWDTTAASHLSVYGYERETTPNLERFAEEAVLFERCLTNAPWTLPSYASLLSGLDPATLRLAKQQDGPRADGDRAYAIQQTVETLPEVLSAAGWRTAAFVDVPWIGVNYGLDQGFEILDHTATGIALDDRTGGLATTVDLGLQWIDSLGDGKQGFLLLHGFDAHGPYFAPEELVQRFRGDRLYEQSTRVLETGAMLGSFGALQDYLNECIDDADGAVPESIRAAEVLAMYDAGLIEVDRHFGGLIAGLEEREALDHWTVLVHADHGETTSRGSWLFAHSYHDREVLNVPLIIRPRGGTAARRVTGDVESLDLYPTILDLAGVSAPTEVGRPGRSLTGALHGAELPPKPLWASGGLLEQDTVVYNGWDYIRRRPITGSLVSRVTYPAREVQAWREERFGAAASGAFRPEQLAALAGHPDRAQLEAELEQILTEIGDEEFMGPPPEVIDDIIDVGQARWDRARALLEERRQLSLDARQVLGEPKVIGKLDDAQLEMLKAAGYVDE